MNFLLSSMAGIALAQVSLSYLCAAGSISFWLPLLFDSATDFRLRKWIALYLHSIAFVHRIDPVRESESCLASHASHASLLLDGSPFCFQVLR
jgi:hypothetical protein